MASKTSSTTTGARPRDGSSSSRSCGLAIRARPMASICCSPPRQAAGQLRRRWPQPGEQLVHPANFCRCLVARGAAVGAEDEVVVHRSWSAEDPAPFGDDRDPVCADPVCRQAGHVDAADLEVARGPRGADRRWRCTSVDLPAPLGPTMLTVSPAPTSRVDAPQGLASP